MRHLGWTGALALTNLAWGPVATAATPTMFAPSDKWHLDYAPDSCVLAREFGQGNQTVVLQIIRYEPQDGFALNLIGRVFRNVEDHSSVELRFGDSGPFVTKGVLKGSAKYDSDEIPAIFLSGRLDNANPWLPRPGADQLAQPQPVTPAQEEAVTSVTLELGGRPLTLVLGSMGAPMAAMRLCTTDLVKHWGFDAVEQAALAALPRPLGNPGTWIRSNDYPTIQLHAGEQAIIHFRLTIDEAGAVNDCSIQSSIASDPMFARQTCALLRERARFTPARTRDGRAVRSFYINTVRWIIPPR